MACSEVDRKFLGQFARNFENDNAVLSSMLFKVLGLSVMLFKALIRARELRKLDSTYAAKSLDLSLHILWLAREGVTIVEHHVLPMAATFAELRVLSYKLRAGFYHIFVLFYDQPLISQAAARGAIALSPEAPARLSSSQLKKASKGKAPDLSGVDTRGSAQPPRYIKDPQGDAQKSELKVLPAANFFLPTRDYTPTALACFKEASDLAERSLYGSHPLRLSVNLEFSIFLDDCMRDGEASRSLAKATLEGVYKAEEGIDDEMFEDSAELVGILGRMMERSLWSGTPCSTPTMSGDSSSDKYPSSKSPPEAGGSGSRTTTHTTKKHRMTYTNLAYGISKRRAEPDWITYKWEVPEALDLRRSQGEHQMSLAETLRSTVVLTGYDFHVEAATCEEYMKKEWGDLGLQLLELVISSISSSPQSHPSHYVQNLSADPNNLCILCQPNLSKTDRHAVAEALAWVCRAIRIPTPGRLSASCSDSQLIRAPIKGSRVHRDHFQDSSKQETSSRSEVQLSFELQELSPFPQSQDLCWRSLFKSGVVAMRSSKHKPRSSENTFARGLEVSFELMVQIAAVELPVLVDEGIVLVGYHTALVPIFASDDSMQWHLEINEEGQINPYKLKSTQRVWSKRHDWKSFANSRCFVGWCPFVHINLGTSVLADRVGWSDSKSRKRTLRWSGISFGGQAATANPLQVGLAIQANFSFVSNKVNFTPTNSFAKLLKDTSKEVAAIIDCLGGRSWLAPKLSLMLHMAHAWSARNGIHPDLIPYAEPCHDGSQAEEALRDSGNLTLLGKGLDTFTLRQLMLGLNINLLQSRQQTEDAGSGKLFGFEFMDIVCEPPMGGSMKKVNIKSQGKCWLSIVNKADAVVVCANLGRAITPVDEKNQRNPNCNVLPTNSNFLAVPLSCLTELIERQGWRGPDPNGKENQSFKISEGHFWKMSGNPFEDCVHNGKSAHHTCWQRDNLLQQITKQGALNNFLRDHKNQTYACGAIYPSEGAVVFGERPVRVEILSL